MIKTSAFLAICLLLVTFAWAQDEELAPASTLAEQNTSCDTTNAHTTMDDDPDAPVGDWCTADTCENTAIVPAVRFDVNTPAGTPDTGTDAQQIAAYVRRCSTGGTDPLCEIDIWCNGTIAIDNTGTFTITSTTGQLIEQSFTFPGACAADGSDLQPALVCRKQGGGANRRLADMDALEWRVTYASDARRVIISQGDK